jgi:hypothetical protein
MLLRIYFLAFLTLLISSLNAQWVVSDPIAVAGSEFGNKGPKIQLFADGTPLVFWGEPAGLGGNLWVARGNSGGSFNSPIQITVPVTPFVSSVEGPELSTGGDQYAYLAFMAGTNAWIARSSDRGETWNSNPMAPGDDASILNQVATDDAGQPTVAWLKDGATAYSWQIASSTDFGASFGTAASANLEASGENVCECCPSTLLQSGDSLFLLFRNNDSNIRDSWIARSTDAGTNFDLASDMDPTDWFITGCPATGPDGIVTPDSVISVWMTGAFGFSEIWVSSLDRDLNLESTRSIAIDGAREPQVDGDKNSIGVVYHKTALGNRLIYFDGSTSGSAGLGNSPIIIGDTAGLSGYPDIAWDGTQFHVVWESTGQVWYSTIKALGTSIEENSVRDIRVWSNAGSIYVEGFEPGDELRIFSLAGELLHANAAQQKLALNHLNSQVLIVQVKSKETIQYHKVLLD